MILLALTTDKISLISGQAVTLDVVVSYVELNSSTFVVNGLGKQLTAITTATTTDILAVPGATTVRNAKMINIRNKHASSSCDVTVQYNANATLYEMHKVTLRAGEALEYVEGVGWYLLATNITTPLIKVLSADATGTDVATAQQWFPTAGAVTVPADTTFQMTGLLATTRAAGATSHTTGTLFAGTASLTTIQYKASVKSGDVETNAAENATMIRVATNTTVKAASTATTETVTIKIDGFVRINATGTFIPQFIYSAAPGGAPTIKANSYFRLDYLGTGGFTVNGTWA